mgnify:CR=1 FL=1
MTINSYLQPLDNNGTLHDYAHADRVFRTDAFRLHPKFAFLYYVRINLDPTYTMFKGLKQKEESIKHRPKFNYQEIFKDMNGNKKTILTEDLDKK